MEHFVYPLPPIEVFQIAKHLEDYPDVRARDG